MSPTDVRDRGARLTDLLDARFMARLDQLDLVSRKILRGRAKGERQSKHRGQGVEFADHRQYAVGDDVRFLDWNIYGRLDQLFLKLFIEEQDLSLHIMVDSSASASMGSPAKDLHMKRLAAALAYVGLVNNNRVTICTFADGVTGRLPNMRGRGYLGHMAEFLAGAKAEGPSDFDKAARQWTANRMGSGITVVLSDFFFKQGYESGLKRLVSDNYDLCVLQVLSPEERRPDLVGDLRLVDCEDADVSEVTVGRALLKHYEQTLAAYCTMLKDFCVQRGAIYSLTDSSQPVERLVLEHLRRLRLVG